jgi:hypothetical protein
MPSRAQHQLRRRAAQAAILDRHQRCNQRAPMMIEGRVLVRIHLNPMRRDVCFHDDL